jgi:threonylcarbamoyladenosine tRNA methylthiotransferase MtaB
VFPYSQRAGTPAARMPQVPGAEVKERAARLRTKGEMALSGYLQLQVGREAELLMERENVGRTPGFAEVQLGTPTAAGDLVTVLVNRSDGVRLHGERVAPTCDP